MLEFRCRLWLLRRLVCEIIGLVLLTSLLLSVGRALRVQFSRIAIKTLVNVGHKFIWIIALDVLPCITALAENCISVVVIVATHAFDRVQNVSSIQISCIEVDLIKAKGIGSTCV